MPLLIYVKYRHITRAILTCTMQQTALNTEDNVGKQNANIVLKISVDLYVNGLIVPSWTQTLHTNTQAYDQDLLQHDF